MDPTLTTAAPSREELLGLFGPEDMVDQELIDNETLEANVAKGLSDAFFLKVSRELRAAFDRSLVKATRTKEDVLAGNAFRMVLMSGPDFAASLVAYTPPKRTAREASETIPCWQQHIAKVALTEVYPLLMASIDRQLNAEHRAATAAGCTGLPAEVVDHKTYIALSNRFQVQLRGQRRALDGQGCRQGRQGSGRVHRMACRPLPPRAEGQGAEGCGGQGWDGSSGDRGPGSGVVCSRAPQGALLILPTTRS